MLLTILTYNSNIAQATSNSKEITLFKLGPENASWNGSWWDESGEEELDAQIPHGTIDGTNITVELPYGIPITQLIPTISITGVLVSPASGVAQDFTNPVIYTVTAEDSSTKEYIVTITNTPNSARSITLFNFTFPPNSQEFDATIIGTNISVTVPFGTDVTSLAPDILFTGASISPNRGAPQDFTNPVVYTVTAEDSSLTRDYTVTVTIGNPADLSILNALIIEAQNKHDIAVEGNLAGQYPAPLKANLQNAIIAVSTLNETSNQSAVDGAVVALSNAIATFESGVIVTTPAVVTQNSSGGSSRSGGYASHVSQQIQNVIPTIDTPPVVVTSPSIQTPIIKNSPKVIPKINSQKKIIKQVQKNNPPKTEEVIPQKAENNLSASVASAPVNFNFSSIFKRFLNWFR